LLNGFTLEEIDGEEYLTIKDVDGLHVAIGRHIVSERKVLTPEEIRFLRKTMDVTQSGLAKILGKDSQAVARWEKGIIESQN